MQVEKVLVNARTKHLITSTDSNFKGANSYIVEKRLSTLHAPYWMGFTRQSVQRGWRNHKGDKIKLDYDPAQFKKKQYILDINRAVMGTVS